MEQVAVVTGGRAASAPCSAGTPMSSMLRNAA